MPMWIKPAGLLKTSSRTAQRKHRKALSESLFDCHDYIRLVGFSEIHVEATLMSYQRLGFTRKKTIP